MNVYQFEAFTDDLKKVIDSGNGTGLLELLEAHHEMLVANNFAGREYMSACLNAETILPVPDSIPLEAPDEKEAEENQEDGSMLKYVALAVVIAALIGMYFFVRSHWNSILTVLEWIGGIAGLGLVAWLGRSSDSSASKKLKCFSFIRSGAVIFCCF